MSGPHQDLEKLWEENKEAPEQPFTYVVFHELNGGGVDDLATEESKERMRHYQPGVSGTPDAEFDGGYVKLGGLSTTSIDYSSAMQAVEDCKTRYERTINPLRPLQSIRNDFKFIELFVDQVFTGEGFAISVKARYLGTSNFVSFESFQGSLYVFMIEENVECYSTVMDEIVINQNVFRGYAIKNQQFGLSTDEEYTTTIEWKIPEAKIPIKPGDVTAVAAVYDMGDTSSSEGNSGNDAQVPRCVQSATPKSSAFDRGNELPIVSEVSMNYNGKVKIEATFDDADGVSLAYVLYNTEALNSTNWLYEEMVISGEEICDDNGVCYAYADSTGSAVLQNASGEFVYFIIIAYDGSGVDSGGLGAQGKSEMFYYSYKGGANKDKGISISSGLIVLLVVVVLILVILAYLIFVKKQKLSITKNISKVFTSIRGKVKKDQEKSQ
jgi:hypothetical protein